MVEPRRTGSSKGARIRCAIYTRKSSEEGLGQEFNSLDAQREACETYAKRQEYEGWRPLATLYDDLGYSGGAMDPPALQRLRAHSPPPSASAAPIAIGIETGEASRTVARETLNGDIIRRRWRSLIGRHPPKTLSHALMNRILVWREQVVENGDISPRSRAILTAALAGKKAHGQALGEETNQEHGARGDRSGAALRVGAAFIREHAGVLHRVTVVAEGFEWGGRIYSSLSAVARAITGVRWNGRRFFALDRGAGQVARKTFAQGAGDARRSSRGPNASCRAGGAP